MFGVLRGLSAALITGLLLDMSGGCAPVLADDIEAYAAGPNSRELYLAVFLDLGDMQRDRVLCRMGSDCAPPFVSATVWSQLRQMYVDGEAVTAPGLFRAVLAGLLLSPEFDELQLALLISNHADNNSGAPGGLRGGGTVLRGYRRLGDSREQTLGLLRRLPQLSAEQAHRLQWQAMLLEWLRYLRGGELALGANTAGNFGQSLPEPDFDRSIVDGERYRAPLAAGAACPEIYHLVFAQGQGSSSSALEQQLVEELPGSGSTSVQDLLTFLHSPQAQLVPGQPGVGGLSGSWLVTSVQAQSALAPIAALPDIVGPMLVDDPVALEYSLRRELGALLRGSGAPYLYAFAPGPGGHGGGQGGVQGDVFLGLAESALGPGWRGNVKKLRLLKTSMSDATAGNPHRLPLVSLVDANGAPALNMSGELAGRLRNSALTLWTDPDTLPQDPNADAGPVDGGGVNRGGAGQKIDGYVTYAIGEDEWSQHYIGLSNDAPDQDGFPPRQVFMENPAGSGLLPFDVSTETVTQLRAVDTISQSLPDADMLALIRRGRGLALPDDERTPQEWLMGAVLHSRPLAVNYGAVAGYSPENPLIQLFFGSGDGLFRIVQNTRADGAQSGRETFAFYPVAALRAQLRAQVQPAIVGQPLYGVDGAPQVLTIDRNGDGRLDHTAGDRVVIYFGLRRGGAGYYALDVSNPGATPTLLWKLAPRPEGDFEELALGFAEPLVGKVNYRGQPEPAVIIPGGYYGGWQAGSSGRLGKDAGAADDPLGNALFVVDALSGDLLWKAVQGDTGARGKTRYQHAQLRDSIASAVAALTDTAGVIHRLYVGDTGGALWRVDLAPNHAAQQEHRQAHWFISKLADLGADAAEPGGSQADDRRFFHAPDLVLSSDSQGDFDGVIITSGNRANPRDILVEDYLFYIKDRVTLSGSEALRTDSEDNSAGARYQFAQIPDQAQCNTESDASDAASCRESIQRVGWKMRMRHSGEKGLSTPVVDGGRVFFTSYSPGVAQACATDPGKGRVYALRLNDGAAVRQGQAFFDLTEGLPDTIQRIDDFLFVPGRPMQLYDLDGDGEVDSSRFLPSHATRAYSLYWREPEQDPR